MRSISRRRSRRTAHCRGDDAVTTRGSPTPEAAFRSARSAPDHCATLSHMEIGVRDLRNRTSQVIDAVQAGERVTLTVHGEPIADIVPHGRRARWLSGAHLRDQLRDGAADPYLTRDLDQLSCETLDEL